MGVDMLVLLIMEFKIFAVRCRPDVASLLSLYPVLLGIHIPCMIHIRYYSVAILSCLLEPFYIIS